MGKKENVELALNVTGADASAIDVKKVEKAFESMGVEGAKAATPITTALQSIQAGIDRYNAKIADGKAVTQKEINAMAQQYGRLEDAIEASGKSVDEFPVEIQQAFDKAKKHVDGATQDFGKLNDAVKDNAAKARVAAGEWPGLAAAIEATHPKLGKMVQSIGQFSAAATEGWSIGTRWAKAMGTDMSEMTKISDSFWNRIGTIVRAFSDAIVQVGFLIQAFISGDLSEMKRAWKDLDEASLTFNKSLKDGLTMSVAEFEKAHPKIKQHEDAVRADTEALGANAAASDSQAAATTANASATTAATAAASAHTLVVDTNTRSVRDNATSTIELTGKLKEGKLSADDAASVMDKLSKAQGGAKTAAELAGESIGQLGRKDVKEAAVKITEMETATTKANTALDGQVKSATPVAPAVASVATAVDSAKTAMEGLGKATGSIDDDLRNIISLAPGVVTALNSIGAAAADTTSKLNALATAAAGAAGSEGSASSNAPRQRHGATGSW